MSAKSQKWTSKYSLDHPTGTADERVGDGDAERLGGLEFGERLDFRGLLNWHWPFVFEKTAETTGTAAISAYPV